MRIPDALRPRSSYRDDLRLDRSARIHARDLIEQVPCRIGGRSFVLESDQGEWPTLKIIVGAMVPSYVCRPRIPVTVLIHRDRRSPRLTRVYQFRGKDAQPAQEGITSRK